MELADFTILSNREIAKDTYDLRLAGNTEHLLHPGQFVQMALPGYFLRRPFSATDWGDGSLRLIYKIVGQGTYGLSKKKEGRLNLIVGLGNGFPIDPSGASPVLIGGGIGVPPLFKLAKELKKTGSNPKVLLGFNRAEEKILQDEFEALGLETFVATMDGSYGCKGTALDLLDDSTDLQNTALYACGPIPMLKAVFNRAKSSRSRAYLSLEERMACGFGACMGCSIHTKEGAKRVCKDGPVFSEEDLLW